MAALVLESEQGGNWSTAEKTLSEWLRQDAANVKAHVAWAEFWCRWGEPPAWPRAEAAANEGMARAAADRRAELRLMLVLSTALLKQSRTREATQLLEQACQKAPMDTRWRVRLIKMLYHDGQGARANSTLQELLTYTATLLKEDHSDADTWAVVGDCKIMNRDEAGARQAFQRALVYVPQHAEALRGLGAIEAGLGNIKAALSYFKRSLEAAPFDPIAGIIRGVMKHLEAKV